MKKYTSYGIAITLLMLCSGHAQAQSTPQALGDTVFEIFKSGHTGRLDRFIPTYSEVTEIYQSLGFDLTARQKDEFPGKYRYHTDIFKKKCAEIAHDTTELNVNWPEAVLKRSENAETPILVEADSANPARTVIRHSLGIYFSTGKKNYVLRFKDIYPCKNAWKLGENVGIRELEPEEIQK